MTINDHIEQSIIFFNEGKSTQFIKEYLNKSRPDIVKELLREVYSRVGISRDEFLYQTGDSAGDTRRKRPENTFAVLSAAIIASMLLIRKDTSKVRKNPRVNAKIAGVSFRKSFAPLWNAETSQKAKNKLLELEIGRTINKAINLKIFRRSGFISSRYIWNEARSARFFIQRKTKRALGFKWVFIPKTSHGHLDECRDIENKWYKISQAPKLPLHVNCKHKYEYHRDLPEGSPMGPTDLVTSEETAEFIENFNQEN